MSATVIIRSDGSSKVTRRASGISLSSHHVTTEAAFGSAPANPGPLNWYLALFRLQSIGGGWIEAQNSRGEVGLVPEDYIEVRKAHRQPFECCFVMR